MCCKTATFFRLRLRCPGAVRLTLVGRISSSGIAEARYQAQPPLNVLLPILPTEPLYKLLLRRCPAGQRALTLAERLATADPVPPVP